jgi:glyceraldehyde-3-phosphate dehydrogenase (NADP+)
MTADVRTRIEGLFPRVEDVPASADVAPGGGVYGDGTLHLVDGEVRRWTGETQEVTSPVCVTRDGRTERRLLGRAASLTKEAALDALAAAVRAYDNGRGPWPTMTVAARIAAVQAFTAAMQKTRETVVRLLMWEIGKTRPDAEKEFK